MNAMFGEIHFSEQIEEGSMVFEMMINKLVIKNLFTCILVREINTNLPSSGSVMVKLETCGYSKIPETGSLNLSWKSSVHSY